MDTFVHLQSPDIAEAVDTLKEKIKGKECQTIKWTGSRGKMFGSIHGFVMIG